MAYARFDDNSDVYVYLGPGGVVVHFADRRCMAGPELPWTRGRVAAVHERRELTVEETDELIEALGQMTEPCVPAGQELGDRFCLSYHEAIDLLRLAETRGYRVSVDCYEGLYADAAAESEEEGDV